MVCYFPIFPKAYRRKQSHQQHLIPGSGGGWISAVFLFLLLLLNAKQAVELWMRGSDWKGEATRLLVYAGLCLPNMTNPPFRDDSPIVTLHMFHHSVYRVSSQSFITFRQVVSRLTGTISYHEMSMNFWFPMNLWSGWCPSELNRTVGEDHSNFTWLYGEYMGI